MANDGCGLARAPWHPSGCALRLVWEGAVRGSLQRSELRGLYFSGTLADVGTGHFSRTDRVQGEAAALGRGLGCHHQEASLLLFPESLDLGGTPSGITSAGGMSGTRALPSQGTGLPGGACQGGILRLADETTRRLSCSAGSRTRSGFCANSSLGPHPGLDYFGAWVQKPHEDGTSLRLPRLLKTLHSDRSSNI